MVKDIEMIWVFGLSEYKNPALSEKPEKFWLRIETHEFVKWYSFEDLKIKLWYVFLKTHFWGICYNVNRSNDEE